MSVELICGDALELAARLAGRKDVAIVSDPPYGIKYKRGGKSRNSISSTGKVLTSRIEGDDKPFDPSPWLDFPAVTFTGAQHYYGRLPAGGSLHCWDKRGNYKPLDQADADMVWCSLPIKSRVFHLVWRGLCRHAENRQRIEHPTQKPVALMAWMIGLLKLKPGTVVVDPYMGSGTTGVAAAQLGLSFIGCEVDPTYFATARRRIDAALAATPA